MPEVSNDDADIEAVLETSAGRRFVRRMLRVTGFHADTFDPDPYVHARNSGGRMIGTWLWDEINAAAPRKVAEMMKETDE